MGWSFRLRNWGIANSPGNLGMKQPWKNATNEISQSLFFISKTWTWNGHFLAEKHGWWSWRLDDSLDLWTSSRFQKMETLKNAGRYKIFMDNYLITNMMGIQWDIIRGFLSHVQKISSTSWRITGEALVGRTNPLVINKNDIDDF